MAISLTCGECGKRLKARDELAGKRLPCPHCGQKILIPEADADIATFLLQEETPPESPPSPAPPSPANEEEEEPIGVRRKPSPAVTKRRKDDVSVLPPLTANEPPLWLRHLHWLLVLALLPLTFSLLSERGEDEREKQFKETLEQAPLDVQLRVIELLDKMEKGEASRADLFAALPNHKLMGAFLSHDSYAHWGFAAGAAILFMAFFVLLASQKTAEPLHLLGFGLFTATIGILLLLLFQVLADWSQGFWVTGRSILVLIFYFVKFIGFSYRAAMDPENRFFLSFMGFTLGVGFCEEVCKALPLLWHYRNPSSQSWRTAFLWGLASGTGFGIAEGILYAGRYYNGISGPGVYVVRFISCVALHALWTGSVGITLHQKQGLIQGEMSWYEYIPRLLVIVGVPMILHGLYDTLLKKDMNALALGVAVLSFLFLAFQISRLHGADDEEAQKAMLREYKRRRAAMS
jgi:RsiW-degrading membrane proteinase PrsW (M82 family)/DNA-directed RNA polymerase subunit RPC12/RpoP